MGFFSWKTLKDPFKGIPVVGGALDAVYDTLPVDNLVRMGEEIGKGNWGSALGNLGIAGLETASWLLPGSQALLASREAGAIGGKSAVKAVAKGLLRPGTVEGLTKGQKFVSGFGPNIWNIGAKTLHNYMSPEEAKAKALSTVAAGASPAKSKLPAISRTSPMSFREADQASMKKAKAISAPDAAERMLAYKKSRGELGLPAGKIRKYPGTPAPAATAPVAQTGELGGQLAPLSAEQMTQVAEQERELQRQYDLLAAEYDKRRSEGEAQATEAARMAGSTAAGEGQNLRTQLAAIGMENAMAPGMVGQEAISNTQALQNADTQNKLASLLADIESGRRQSAAARELGSARNQQAADLMRILNTINEQNKIYQQFGGQ